MTTHRLLVLGVILTTANLTSCSIELATGVSHPLIIILQVLGIPGSLMLLTWQDRRGSQ